MCAPVRECSDQRGAHGRLLFTWRLSTHRRVRDIGTLKPQSGSAETDAGAIPMLWRWFAFVWFTGIGVTGKTWLDSAHVMQSMSRRGYFPHGGGVLLGARAAAALCCLVNAAIVPDPRVSGYVRFHI